MTMHPDDPLAPLQAASEGFWLDDVVVISPDGCAQPPTSLLVWQGRIYPQGQNGEPSAPAPNQLPRVRIGEEYVLLPGMINSHTHLAMSLFKGLAACADAAGMQQQDPSQSLVENLFFTLERHLTPELIAGLCYPSLLEALHSGTTSVVDSYFFSEQVAEAMVTVGMRGFVSEHFADLGGPHQKGLKDWPDFKTKFAAPPSERVGRIVYAHATDTVSRPLLEELAAFAQAEGLPFNMHLAQSFGETARTMAHAQQAPIPYALDCGAVTEDAVLVHLVDCPPRHLDLLKPHRPTIALCPVSEVLYETLPQLPMLVDSGLPIVLGTDCPASNDGFDMGEEMRALALFYKLQSGRLLPSRKVLDMVWRQPSQLWYRQEPLAAGSYADFSLMRKNISFMPVHDWASQLVYSHTSRHIEAVFIGGQLLSRHGRYMGQDAQRIQRQYEQAMAAIEKLLWEKFGFRSAGHGLGGLSI